MGARVLLVCDGCHHYFHAGKRSADELRPNDFNQVSGALVDEAELLEAARDAGWRQEKPDAAGRTLWFCPECETS